MPPTYASGSRPHWAAFSSLISSTAAAPSVTGDELPAVSVPFSGSKTGFSAARASSEVSARGPESASSPSSGWISPASLSRAATALRWLARATSSCLSRGISHSLQVNSMCSPMFRPVDGSRKRSMEARVSESTPPARPASMRPPAMASATTVTARKPVMQ